MSQYKRENHVLCSRASTDGRPLSFGNTSSIHLRSWRRIRCWSVRNCGVLSTARYFQLDSIWFKIVSLIFYWLPRKIAVSKRFIRLNNSTFEPSIALSQAVDDPIINAWFWVCILDSHHFACEIMEVLFYPPLTVALMVNTCFSVMHYLQYYLLSLIPIMSKRVYATTFLEKLPELAKINCIST